MGAAPRPTATLGSAKRLSAFQRVPLKAAATSAPPPPASATHTALLFCCSTAAGATGLRALGAARLPRAVAGSRCHHCQKGAPSSAPTVAHPPRLLAAASSV